MDEQTTAEVRSPSSGWALVGIAVTVGAILVGLHWYLDPANRVTRALAGVDMPKGVTADGGELSDNGWLCWDSCSSGSRYYVSSLPPEEVAPLIEKALYAQGWSSSDYRGGGMNPCIVYEEGNADCLLAGPGERDRGRAAFTMSVDKGFTSGWVSVGARADGRYGVELVLVAKGYG